MKTLAFVGVFALVAADASAALSRDINSYVLFAGSSLNFKGRDGQDVTRGVIKNGNVGVNRIDPTPNSGGWLLNMGGGGSSHPVVMGVGSQVVADSMNLGGSDVTAWDIYANIYSNATQQANRNSGPTGFSGPVLSMPGLGFTPGRASTNAASDVTVNDNLTLNLVTGTYRDVRVKDGATLNLGAGTYDFRNMVGGKNITINVTDATIILVDGQFTFNNNGKFGLGTQGNARIYAGSFGVGANDATIAFSRNTEAHGLFYAPNGNLNLGNHTDLFGHFWADDINSDWNVSMDIPAPGSIGLIALGGIVVGRRRRV